MFYFGQLNSEIYCEKVYDMFTQIEGNSVLAFL